jgi:hypothetical protein
MEAIAERIKDLERRPPLLEKRPAAGAALAHVPNLERCSAAPVARAKQRFRARTGGHEPGSRLVGQGVAGFLTFLAPPPGKKAASCAGDSVCTPYPGPGGPLSILNRL